MIHLTSDVCNDNCQGEFSFIKVNSLVRKKQSDTNKKSSRKIFRKSKLWYIIGAICFEQGWCVLDKNMNISFGKNSSQALKGVAILLLMLHHNFREVRLFKDYNVSFWPFAQGWVVNAADMAKICVSLFAFITGYGLYLSCKNDEKNESFSPSKWVAVRYIKTFSGYWIIWMIASVATQIIDGRFVKVYFEKNIWDGFINTGFDFLGVANLFQSPTLNITWWYMSAAFVFIVITPLLVKNEKYLPIIFVVTVLFTRMISGANGKSVFTGGNSTWAFVTVFMMGMIFARYNIIERIVNAKGRLCRFVIEIILLAVVYKAYGAIDVNRYWEIKWTLIPLVVIMFSVEFVVCIPVIRQVLKFIGKHSMNIFLTHTFVRYYYLTDFTYSWKHFVMIIFVLLVVSLAISYAVEFVKKITGYNKLVEKVCDIFVSEDI